MERITGPFLGHYVAAYAVKTEAGYVGYAKICSEQPADVWQCNAMEKIGGRPASTWSTALKAVEEKAVLFLQQLHDYYGLLEPSTA